MHSEEEMIAHARHTHAAKNSVEDAEPTVPQLLLTQVILHEHAHHANGRTEVVSSQRDELAALTAQRGVGGDRGDRRRDEAARLQPTAPAVETQLPLDRRAVAAVQRAADVVVVVVGAGAQGASRGVHERRRCRNGVSVRHGVVERARTHVPSLKAHCAATRVHRRRSAHRLHHHVLELDRVGGEGADVLRRVRHRRQPRDLELRHRAHGRRHAARHRASIGENLTVRQRTLRHHGRRIVEDAVVRRERHRESITRDQHALQPRSIADAHGGEIAASEDHAISHDVQIRRRQRLDRAVAHVQHHQTNLDPVRREAVRHRHVEGIRGYALEVQRLAQDEGSRHGVDHHGAVRRARREGEEQRGVPHTLRIHFQ